MVFCSRHVCPLQNLQPNWLGLSTASQSVLGTPRWPHTHCLQGSPVRWKLPKTEHWSLGTVQDSLRGKSFLRGAETSVGPRAMGAGYRVRALFMENSGNIKQPLS